jgi:predicted kinase
MAALLLIQMSGVPGAGKSTLARTIGRHTGAVVLDHDVVKTALLEAGVPWPDAGRASYQTLQVLAKSLLDQQHSVVLDSPCLYQDLLDAGLRVAEETGACYRYVECVVDDFSEIDRRLRGRTSLSSQRAALDAPPASFAG